MEIVSMLIRTPEGEFVIAGKDLVQVSNHIHRSPGGKTSLRDITFHHNGINYGLPSPMECSPIHHGLTTNQIRLLNTEMTEIYFGPRMKVALAFGNAGCDLLWQAITYKLPLGKIKDMGGKSEEAYRDMLHNAGLAHGMDLSRVDYLLKKP
jgi:hypothetical protein